QPVPLATVRIGIPRGVLFGETQAEVAEAFEACIDRIGQAGAGAVDLPIDDLIAEMRAATRRGTIASMEGAEVHADWLASGASVPVDPHVTGPLSRALSVPASAYIRTIRRRGELATAMAERLEAVDVLALPTVPIVTPSIAAMAGDEALRDRTEG
ncbi:amidase family protein, partial [Mesorhizobium sp. M2A.F.Ca.ET.067.02.1.1]|uniref:amidase family protein n=1 Tax=Mesorhizobium sp. M2A.F.Ca.ET.067.02.1.1 TaxID=2496749 RepID=UPI000FD27C3A